MKALAHHTRRPRNGGAGFTLVEVLVALVAMALLATLAWQGLDSVLRAREDNRARIDEASRLATVLTQWEQDLLAIHDTGVVPALNFDGLTLRLTRRVDGGVALVAWSVRGGQWQRWLGPPTVRTGELQEVWLRSLQLLGNEPGHLTVATGASEWQMYYHRGSEWSNAQSTGNLAQAPQGAVPGAPVVREALPVAVRVVITLPAGRLTRDIALAPQGS